MSTLLPSDPNPISREIPPGFREVLLTIPVLVPDPPTDLLDNDGVPLETDWHRLEMNLLIDTVAQHLRPRRDFFVGGNMFIYYSAQQARDLDYRGPDFFFAAGVPLDKPRRYWAIWDEGGKFPNVLVELGSPTTLKTDRTTKKQIYQTIFKTPDYFIYDPDGGTLEGYRWIAGEYQPKVPNDKDWLWCDELGLWLGKWQGTFQEKTYTYLRWFDQEGKVVPTLAEAEEEKAQIERQRAEAERQRAEAERQRADTAEAELKRLRAFLEKQRHVAPENGPGKTSDQ